MAYEPTTTEEQKKLILLGKKRPMNLAYNPGPKNADLLILHRIKAPDVIARIAKKEGEGSRVAFGSFEVKGRKFRLTAEQTLPGLSKALRKHLKTLDLSFKVEICDSTGAVLEADDEEDGPAQAAAPLSPEEIQRRHANRIRLLQQDIAAVGPTGAPLKKALRVIVQTFKAGDYEKTGDMLYQVEEKLEAFQKKANANSDPVEAAAHPPPKVLLARAASLKSALPDLEGDAAPKIRNALVQAITQLQARAYDQAHAKLTAVEKAVNALAKRTAAAEPQQADAPEPEPQITPDIPPAPSPEEQTWGKVQAGLLSAIDEAQKAGLSDVAAVQRAFAFAQEQAASGNFDAAVKAGAATQKLLQEAQAAPMADGSEAVTEAQELTPNDVEAYRTSQTEWAQTRNGLRADLAQLKMAIDAKTQGIAGLEDVANNTAALLDYLEDLDTSLEQTMTQLVATQDGIKRQKLKDAAQKTIAAYRETLDTDFFKAVDNNGFIETNIRDTALNALKGVETALAA